MERGPTGLQTGATAARMDAIYRPQRRIYDATRRFFLPGRDALIAGLALPHGGKVLELGCGTARNLVRAAAAWPKARFFGIDVSGEMLKSARKKIDHAGLGETVMIAQGDATRFDPQLLFGEDRFDRVFISYALSMIPDWEIAIEAGIGVLSNRGSLHIVDFGSQEKLPGTFRNILRGWLARFHVEPRDGLEAVLRHAALRHHASLEFGEPYRGYSRLAVLRLGQT
jgi:S-adenosylmethionine-diacylgycerolhomoserine-N-methlytransferase